MSFFISQRVQQKKRTDIGLFGWRFAYGSLRLRIASLTDRFAYGSLR